MPGDTSNQEKIAIAPAQTDRQRGLLTVAEGLHPLNRQFCAAVSSQDGTALAALARQHLGGAQALAVNLGPSRTLARHTPWVTETLQRELSVPLFLSAGALAFPDLLQRSGASLTINAVTADPATLPTALDLANECGAALVVLLVRPGLTPAGSADRLNLAAEVIDLAWRQSFPLPRLFLDPVLSLRPDPLAWRISRGMPDLGPVAETISQLSLLADGQRTIIALGNCPGDAHTRPDLQATILTILAEAGLDAVLINGRDLGLLQLCRDRAAGGLPAPACRAA